MLDDEDVMVYILNELIVDNRLVDIFKVMMEYEDYPLDWLMDQFMMILTAVDNYDGVSDRASEFYEAVQKLNFMKVDAHSGEVSEIDTDDDEEYSPWNR
jgi:hypothetical protein|tara:strand:- start:607 stop:903 length:297 start_codon:yes stop_codon:yes gene_type:complete